MLQTDVRKQGDTFFLNLRFLLISTVFLGNIIEPLIGEFVPVETLYLWIFTFHMPLFVLVTGYFARYSMFGEEGKKMLQQIVLQYIIFQSLYSIMDVFVFHLPGIRHSFFLPYLLCWFLLSHLCWRAVFLLFHYLKVKHPVPVSIGLAVLVGYAGFDGGFLSLSRTFVFLPFFFIGYTFDYAQYVNFFTRWGRAIAAAGSVVLMLVLGATAEQWNAQWLIGSFTFSQMDHTEWYAGALRLLVYGLEASASLAFLAWVPRSVCRITDWGRRTVYIFLLHGFVVRTVAISGVYAYIDHPLEIALLLAATIGCTILLGQPFVKEWTHAVIEPQTNWLLRAEQKAKGMLGAR